MVAFAQRLCGTSVDAHVDLPAVDHVEPVARLAFPHDLLSGRDANGNQVRRELLDHRRRERPEERDCAQTIQAVRRGSDPDVECAQSRQAEHREHDEERAGRDQRATDVQRGDQHRREHGPEAERPHEHALHDAHHPREDLVRDRPLEQRHAGDVHDRHADARDAEQEERGGGGDHDANEGDRHAEHQQPETERRCEACATDERERSEASDEGTDADGRIEVADSRVAEVQELQCRDDDQHVQRSGDQGLASVQADEQPQERVVRDRPEPGEELAEAPVRHRRLGRALRANSGEEQGGDEEHAGGHGEHAVRPDRGEEHAAERRADELARSLDRRQHEVRGGELVRRAGEGGEERRLRRPEGRLEQAHDARERVHDPGGRVRVGSHRRTRDRGRPAEVDRDEDTFPRVAVAQARDERGGDDGGQDPQQAHQAERGGAAALVGVERERDDEDPVGAVASRPGELEAAQARVREDGGECTARLGEPLPQRAQHPPIVSGFAFFEKSGKIGGRLRAATASRG